MSDALEHLRAIFPDHDVARLRSVLNASRGNCERATLVLLGDSRVISSASPSARPAKRSRTSLDGWLGKDASGSPERKAKRDTTQPASPSAPAADQTSMQGGDAAVTQPSAFDALKQAPESPSKKLPPLTLTSSEMIREHTRDTIVIFRDFFPKPLAARLFLSMLEEEKTWERNRWWLATREVESPHTTQFYCERKQADSSHNAGYDKAAQHWYNGQMRQTRFFTPEMDEARRLVAAKVQEVLREREKHPLEWTGPWQANVAASNCYRGSQEGVHFHSDVMTYLGPRACIASISLGVERVFRLRAAMATPEAPARTLSIPLPHNSLAIMLPGCQELFKHSIPPIGAGGLDRFKLPFALAEQLEVADEMSKNRGWNERINITFRFYRPDFAPLPDPPLPPQHPTYAGTPNCRCGKPCVLRPDAKAKSRNRLIEQGTLADDGTFDPAKDMLYYWQCSAGAQNEGKGCMQWKQMDFRAEGRGPYFVQATRTVANR